MRGLGWRIAAPLQVPSAATARRRIAGLLNRVSQSTIWLSSGCWSFDPRSSWGLPEFFAPAADEVPELASLVVPLFPLAVNANPSHPADPRGCCSVVPLPHWVHLRLQLLAAPPGTAGILRRALCRSLPNPPRRPYVRGPGPYTTVAACPQADHTAKGRARRRRPKGTAWDIGPRE